jgi:AraC family transcriptional regulator
MSVKSDLLGKITYSRRSSGGFLVSETVYAPGMVLPWHAHERANFSFVLEGAYEERFGRRRRDCEPGMLVVHPAGERHADAHWNRPVRLLTVEIEDARLRSIRDSARVLDDSLDARGVEYVRLAKTLEAEFHRNDSAAPLAMEALVLEVLAASMRSAELPERDRRPAWLRRIVDELEAKPNERYTMGSLAAQAGVHAVHLARVFRRHHGCTVAAYQRTLRVKAACADLRAGSAPLSAIAQKAGFSDQSHFSRVFRRVMGLTPGEYRREAVRSGTLPSF